MPFKYPSGMIAPFDSDCPAGWTRVSAWDNKFFRGASSSGGSGGSTTHTHYSNPPSGYSPSAGQGGQSVGGTDGHASTSGHGHPFDLPNTATATATSLPPYINVVFCKKD